MHQLIERIAAIGVAVDTCICLGASGGELPGELAVLNPRRLVLVAGDAHAADELALQATAWPFAEVQHHVVAPEAAALPWFTYNLSAFNGPLDAAPLGRYYPRLSRIGQAVCEARGVAEWLTFLNVKRGDDARLNVLVLDVPGQELGLLGAIPVELIEEFDVIAVLGCNDASYAGASTVPAVLQTLIRSGFQVSARDEGQPLWPVAVAWLDRQAVLSRRLERRLHDLERAQDEQRQMHAIQTAALHARIVAAEQATSERQGQVEALAQAKTEAERAVAELQAHVTQLAAARAAAERTAQEQRAAVEAEVHAKSEAERVATELQVQAEQLAAARDAAERIVHEQHMQISAFAFARDGLERSLAQTHDQLQQAVETKAAIERLMQDGMAQLDAMGSAKALVEHQAANLQTQLNELFAAKMAAEQLAHDRLVQLEGSAEAKAAAERAASDWQAQAQLFADAKAAAEHLAHERQVQIDDLSRAKSAAEAAAAEATARVQQLAAAHGDLEVRLGSVQQEVALARAAHQGAEELALEFGGKLKELIQWRDTRNAEFDKLHRQMEQAVARADEEHAKAGQIADELAVQRARLASLESELRDNRRALNVAVRTQALREHDLRELRERYAAIQREQDASEELVARLAERLTAAQRYFDQMKVGPATVTTSALSVGTSKAQGKPGPRKRKATPPRARDDPSKPVPASPVSRATEFDSPSALPNEEEAVASNLSSESAAPRRRRGKKTAAHPRG